MLARYAGMFSVWIAFRSERFQAVQALSRKSKVWSESFKFPKGKRREIGQKGILFDGDLSSRLFRTKKRDF